MQLTFGRGLIVAAITFGLGSPSIVSADPTVFSSARILAGNNIGGVTYVADVAPWSFSSTQGQTASISSSAIFSGNNSSGAPSSMTLDYAAKAQADATQLKVSASGTLTGAYFNAGNSPYVIDTNFTVDPNGSPTYITVGGQADLNDTLTVVGGPGLAYIKANIGIDGKILGYNGMGNIGGLALLQLAGVQNFNFTPIYLERGNFDGDFKEIDTMVMSNAFAVNAGAVNFGLRLDASVSYYFMGFGRPLQNLYEGYVDFFNTLTIDSFTGYDAQGNIVDLASVTGSGGQSYAVTQVPEPASLVMFGIGLAGLIAVRRRKIH
jgi:hypothetical protein